MKTNVLFTVVVSLSVIINVVCNTASHEPPLPPIVDNCSFNNSQLVTDTPWIPLSPPVIMPQHHYYEGYEILDVAFNPNDPNKIAVALYVYDSGVINEITTNGSAIVVYDLCNEQSSTIYAYDQPSSRISCLNWGTNDSIVFVHPVPPPFGVYSQV